MAEFAWRLSLLPLFDVHVQRQDARMTLLLVFLGMLVVVSVAAMLDLIPDTHRQVTQHGDFKF